jgi:hypothetical protein
MAAFWKLRNYFHGLPKAGLGHFLKNSGLPGLISDHSLAIFKKRQDRFFEFGRVAAIQAFSCSSQNDLSCNFPQI